MNEQAIYYFMMFLAGAILARITFHLQNKSVEKTTIQLLSAQIITAFEFMYNINKTYVKDKVDFYTKANSWDESQKYKYLDLEERQLDQQLSIATLLLISSFKKKFGKDLLFENWNDIRRILKRAEELVDDEKDNG
jgi:hypothetical protein